MTICGGCEVDPPNRAWSAAKLAGMPHQIEVRAVHEVAPAAAQTNGAAAQLVGLPSASRRNGVEPEQNFGDLAVLLRRTCQCPPGVSPSPADCRRRLAGAQGMGRLYRPIRVAYISFLNPAWFAQRPPRVPARGVYFLWNNYDASLRLH
jgi:hypothetical protein